MPGESMAPFVLNGRDIVVIGASAGGLEPLRRIVARLPPSWPAIVAIVWHLPAWGTSRLPEILSRAGPLAASTPTQSEPVQHGHIYVAPPDHHLLFEDESAYVWRGPKENLLRPSINALFRSAAVIYRTRVIGVVLSGSMDDGVTGLWWIKRYGGICVVQDPADAQIPAMPTAAIKTVRPDYIMPADAIPELLIRLVAAPTTAKPDQ